MRIKETVPEKEWFVLFGVFFQKCVRPFGYPGIVMILFWDTSRVLLWLSLFSRIIKVEIGHAIFTAPTVLRMFLPVLEAFFFHPQCAVLASVTLVCVVPCQFYMIKERSFVTFPVLKVAK